MQQIIQTNPSIVYIAPPEVSEAEARVLAQNAAAGEPLLLRRRGTTLGWIAPRTAASPAGLDPAVAWHASQPVVLRGFVARCLPSHQQQIRKSLRLMEQVVEGRDVAELLSSPTYEKRTCGKFEMLASFQDEADGQEIETVEYDAIASGEVVGENLWCKVSWLSFDDDDVSLRFRFSFGLAGYEDVAADAVRQRQAADLAEAIFPESEIISGNAELMAFLQQALGIQQPEYVERIIYFNAPDGGAQFHQDIERGHLGVVFAQLCGRTAWFTCAKSVLLDEIQHFLGKDANTAALARLLPDARVRQRLLDYGADRARLNTGLDCGDDDALELLLNRCPEFYCQLTAHGHAFILNPGDIILLPQQDLDHCAWHTVFCLDDFVGEALSFAFREADTEIARPGS